jgi:hypothetical protein
MKMKQIICQKCSEFATPGNVTLVDLGIVAVYCPRHGSPLVAAKLERRKILLCGHAD